MGYRNNQVGYPKGHLHSRSVIKKNEYALIDVDGTVKNSVLFRGVKVEKGAVVENCILMQGTAVGANAGLACVISDKNATIGSNMVLKGTAEKCVFVKKNQTL